MRAPKALACLKIIAFFALVFSAFTSTQANAAVLEKLSDGRVVVTAFGEKLAFRQKDAGRIEFEMITDACNPKHSFMYTLKQWFEDPKIAQCMERAIPSNSGGMQAIQISIEPTIDDGLLFPGGISQDQLAPDLLKEHLNIALNYPPGSNCQSDKDWRSGPPGYQVRFVSRSPPQLEYRTSADRRIGSLSRPLCILCKELESACGVVLNSRDYHAVLYFTWRVPGIYTPNTANWPSYDKVARDIARSIFIDRPAGDFQ